MLKWYEKIKILRKRNGWSQTELAQRVGYTDKSMISKIEKGSVDIPRSQVIKFADTFNITASELIGEAVAEVAADLDDLERVILSNFRKLSPHDKKAVSIMIQTMADNTEPSAPAADLDKTIEEKQTEEEVYTVNNARVLVLNHNGTKAKVISLNDDGHVSDALVKHHPIPARSLVSVKPNKLSHIRKNAKTGDKIAKKKG